MIVAENLTKYFGSVPALDRINFTVNSGESVALWGTNGAGKTTALRCLLGLMPFEGKLTVNQIDARRQGKAVRAVIGYVPQEAAFYDLTVWETLEYYARLKKVSSQLIPAVLDQVRLTAQGQKPVNDLSGGMKQRLALAVALLSDPPVLVLDEPTANLDIQAQRDFIHLVQRLNQSGKTIIFSSHRLDEVLALAERVLVLTDGRLTLECRSSELAGKLGLHQWMRIQVPQIHHDPMLQLLRNQNFTFTPNGHAVYVRVQAENKTAPLQAIESAHIPIEDFYFVDSSALPVQDETP